MKTKFVNCKITNPDGSVVFQQDNVEVPEQWSDRAATIAASKYFAHGETSVLQVVDRIVNQITEWGVDQEYFVPSKDSDGSQAFAINLKDILLNQRAAFNSPVWFNVGVPENNSQIAACFILDVEDNMEDILQQTVREGLTFKWGSGTGVNVSKLRANGESLSNKGKSSGPLGFMKIWDQAAGSIKSGGRSRRSAKLVCIDIDHPDVEEFITCKKIEEDKAKILIAGGVDSEKAYQTVAFQNSNHSIMVTDEFMEAVKEDKDWDLVNRGDKEIAKTLPAKDLFKQIAQCAWDTGDPGIQFRDRINKDNPVPSIGDIDSSNPCFTGDTLIAVADGRGMVPIKQLAEEDVDVLTYTLNSSGKLIVKPMINPRLTRKNAEVFKVTFDSGLELKTTIDHEYLTTDGELIPLIDLKVGDSIKSLVKHTRSFKDMIKFQSKYEGKDYYSWENNGNFIFDHRIIGEYKKGGKLQTGEVVHHKDYNPLNNCLNNLEILSKSEHDKLHAKDMQGLSNPVHKMTKEWGENISSSVKGIKNGNFSDITNEEIVYTLKQIAEKSLYGYVTKEMCRECNLPYLNTRDCTKHSSKKYRLDNLQAYADLADVEYIKTDIFNSIKRKHNNLTKNNFKFTYDKSKREFIIEKTCEETGKVFYVGYKNRHVSFFDYRARGLFCGKRKVRFIDGKINEKYLEHKNTKARLQKTLELVDYYKNNRDKHKNFLKEYTKAKTVVRHNNIFCPSLKYLKKNYKEMNSLENIITLAEENLLTNDIDKRLRSEAIGDSYNHKIVSIEPAGIEDVYDCTVEKEHLVLVGGQEKTNKFDKLCWHFIVTSNCGEHLAVKDSACNLASLNLVKYLDKYNELDIKKFCKDIYTIVTAQDIMIDMADYPTPESKRVAIETRPIGLGYSNLGAYLMLKGLPYDSKKARKEAKKITRLMTWSAYDTSIKLGNKMGSFLYYENNLEGIYYLAKRLTDNGTNLDSCNLRNSQLTLLQPAGTIGFLMDNDSTGIEPLFALKSYKKLAGGGTMEITPGCVEQAAYNIAKSYKSDKSIEEVIKLNPKVFATANEISPMGHIKMMAAVQPFLNGAISKTINMPNTCTVEDIEQAYLDAWELGLKSITVYRDGSKTLQPLTAKKEEDITIKKEDNNEEKWSVVRRRMPKTRESITHKFNIGGFQGYLTAGMYEDGTLGELFITAQNQGSTLNGILDSFATAISYSLQYGVPVEKLTDKFIGSRFEPAGFTGDDDVPMASSVIDYIFKWLKINFTDEEDEQVETINQKQLTLPKNVSFDGPPCQNCGAITHKAGSCYLCSNCGDNSGSCG